MEGAKCPYCQAAYKEEDGKCAECKALFPWAIEAREIREDIKSREVNRGRATFTLIEEIYKYGKEGKPVSMAAMKGFAFAWLFPRTVILLGSILAGAVLVVQTAIIYRQNELIEGQNELMQKQTVAMQLEHTEKLRLRIAANAELVDRLTELSNVKMTGFADFNHDWSSDLLDVTYMDRYADRNVQGPSLFGLELGSLGHAMLGLLEAAHKFGESPQPTGYTAMAALNQAGIRCSFQQETILVANDTLVSLRPFAEPPPTRANKFAGFLLRRKLADFSGITSPYSSALDQTVIKGALQKAGNTIHSALKAAAASCTEKIKEDRAAVVELERTAAITSPATASAPSATASR